MKQIWPTYAYSPTTNVLTLTGLNIDRDQLLLVTAADRGRIMYNFADSSVTASAFTSGANTALTLVATTAGLTTTAALVIYFDDQLTSTTVTVSSLPAISGTVTANVFGQDSNDYTNVKIPVCSYDVPIESASSPYVVPVQISSTNGSVGSSNPLPISGTVTVGNTVTISGTVTANPTGTQTIAGTVTANLGNATSLVGGGYGNFQDLISNNSFSIYGGVGIEDSLPAGTNQIGSVTASISNSVTIASLPAISGTVTANTFALQGTAVTTSNFTSTTASTVLANYNATREVLTIFNEGAGNLFVCPGATCTTVQYQIRLSSGDYYEVPNHQTTITHSAVFATAGTARIVQIS